MYYQKTLLKTVECGGIGLHSGKRVKLRLLPAEADTGIVFRRTDKNVEIPASIDNLSQVNFATTLSKNAIQIKTVEHVLAALYSLGIDNCYIESDNIEIPIMDGSAAPFVYLIRSAGVQALNKPRKVLKVTKSMEIVEGDRSIAVIPCSEMRVTYTIEFPHPLILRQSLSLSVTKGRFIHEIAPARTFGFMRDVERLRVAGLTLGGSLDNAVVLDESHVLNQSLRYPDEFVRHKFLDLLGDLALLGVGICGHIIVNKGGHALHARMTRLLKQTLHLNEVMFERDTLLSPKIVLS